MINSQFFDSVMISDISVISGIRDRGRIVDNSHTGRKRHGFFYIHSGEAIFYADGEDLVVSSGNLLYIPKNKKYKMAYTAESTTFVVVNFEIREFNKGDAFLYENIEVIFKSQKKHFRYADNDKF